MFIFCIRVVGNADPFLCLHHFLFLYQNLRHLHKCPFHLFYFCFLINYLCVCVYSHNVFKVFVHFLHLLLLFFGTEHRAPTLIKILYFYFTLMLFKMQYFFVLYFYMQIALRIPTPTTFDNNICIKYRRPMVAPTISFVIL